MEWLAALLLLGIVLALVVREICRKPPRFPPGPAFVPILGSATALTLTASLPHLVFRALGKLYGNVIGLYLFGQPVVILRDFELIRTAFNKFEFSGREQTFVIQNRSNFMGNGIIFGQGASWKLHRAFAKQQLHDLGVGRPLAEQLVQKEVDELVDLLRRSADRDLEVNNVFCLSGCNTVLQIAAGKRYALDDPVFGRLVADTEAVMRLAGPGNILSLLPWTRHLAPAATGYRALCRLRDDSFALFGTIIDEHRSTLDPHQPRDYVDAFLVEMAKDGAEEREFTKQHLEVLLLDLFQAALETLNSTMCWACLLLALHPEVQSRLQADLDARPGDKPLQWADRHCMPYLEATINEIHRFGTVTNVSVPHYTSFKSADIGEFAIPRNTLVLPDIYHVHHDPAYWREPHRFRPERFLGDDGQLIHEPRLLVFGTGRRSCLGASLARLEVFLFITGLLRAFSLELPEGAPLPDLTPQAGVTYKPRPFRLRFRPRRPGRAEPAVVTTTARNEQNSYCTKRASFSSKIKYSVEREI